MIKLKGGEIGNLMFEKYVKLKEISKREDLDPEVKQEIIEFLDIFDEYIEFIGKYVRVIRVKLEG